MQRNPIKIAERLSKNGLSHARPSNLGGHTESDRRPALGRAVSDSAYRINIRHKEWLAEEVRTVAIERVRVACMHRELGDLVPLLLHGRRRALHALGLHGRDPMLHGKTGERKSLTMVVRREEMLVGNTLLEPYDGSAQCARMDGRAFREPSSAFT